MKYVQYNKQHNVLATPKHLTVFFCTLQVEHPPLCVQPSLPVRQELGQHQRCVHCNGKRMVVFLSTLDTSSVPPPRINLGFQGVLAKRICDLVS